MLGTPPCLEQHQHHTQPQLHHHSPIPQSVPPPQESESRVTGSGRNLCVPVSGAAVRGRPGCKKDAVTKHAPRAILCYPRCHKAHIFKSGNRRTHRTSRWSSAYPFFCCMLCRRTRGHRLNMHTLCLSMGHACALPMPSNAYALHMHRPCTCFADAQALHALCMCMGHAYGPCAPALSPIFEAAALCTRCGRRCAKAVQTAFPSESHHLR
mmetsp:Transcript_4039/g.11522  ORF Transcript_4039/g.11522 Transcript_4039/m.11522 type:complete len:210 (-) Transcript_4039:1301-1930(-)